MMMNEQNSFKGWMQEISRGETPPPADVWNRIESTLNNQPRKRALYFWPLMALLVLGVGGSIWLLSRVSEEPAKQLGAAVTRPVQNPSMGATRNSSFVEDAKSSQRITSESPQGIEQQTNLEEATPKFAKKETIEQGVPSTAKFQKVTKSQQAVVEPIQDQQEPALSEVNRLNSIQDEIPVSITEPTIESTTQVLGSSDVTGLMKNEYSIFTVYGGAGVFGQNLRMGRPHADSVAFSAQKGIQYSMGVTVNINKNWAIDLGYGRSSNEWISSARLIIEQNQGIGTADLDTSVYLSSSFEFEELTNSSAKGKILAAAALTDDVHLSHKLEYAHYRLGAMYSLNDYTHWSFSALLQVEYMQLLRHSSQFVAGDFSMPYIAYGFRTGIWGLRPGLNIAYRINRHFAFYLEGNTTLRGTYLMQHPNWEVYENQYGLIGGLRYSW